MLMVLVEILGRTGTQNLTLRPLAIPLRRAQEPCKTRKNGRVEGMGKSYRGPSNLVACLILLKMCLSKNDGDTATERGKKGMKKAACLEMCGAQEKNLGHILVPGFCYHFLVG